MLILKYRITIRIEICHSFLFLFFCNFIFYFLSDKPRIDASALKDIVVKAGEQFKITVPFTGFPKPEAIWSVGEKDIDDKDPRIYQKVDTDEAFLVNKSAKRSDTGPYKVFLKNKSGFDTAYCKVTVLGKIYIYFDIIY